MLKVYQCISVHVDAGSPLVEGSTAAVTHSSCTENSLTCGSNGIIPGEQSLLVLFIAVFAKLFFLGTLIVNVTNLRDPS